MAGPEELSPSLFFRESQAARMIGFVAGNLARMIQ